MGIQWADFQYKFDDVQFGIDIREKRLKLAMTQDLVGRAVGWNTGAAVTAIEAGRYEKSLSVDKFIALCDLFALNPLDYYTLERKVDMSTNRAYAASSDSRQQH